MARLAVKLRWPIVVFWVAAAVFLTLALPNLREAQTGALGDLVPADAEAIDAEERSRELFGFPLLARTILVQRDPGGLSPRAQARVAERAYAINEGLYPELRGIVGALAITNTLGRPPFSRERSTTALTYLFFHPIVGRVDQERLADLLIENHYGPEDAVVGVTGPVAAREAQAGTIEHRLPIVEAATVLLVALAVGAHFRAVGAPLLTLGAVAVSYLVAIRAIAWIGQQLSISVPSEVEPVMVVLLFGIVTDYSVFFLSRFRSKLRAGLPRLRAAEDASAELIPIIVTAGVTIVLASAALVVAQVGFLQAFGPGLAMAVLVGLIVTITLVPALLAIAGDRVFWPRRPRRELRAEATLEETPDEATGRRRRFRAVRLASERPVLVTAGSVLILVVAAAGITRLEVGNPLIRGLPEDSDARVAYESASRGFTPGILSPTVVVVERPGLTADRRALARLQRLLERQPGVAEVAGPADQPFRLLPGATLSPTGDAARYVVVLGVDPLGGAAVNHLTRLRERMPALLRDAGLPEAEASVAGDTALVAETVDRTFADIGRVAPVAVLAVLLGLAVFVRALVAPLYLLAASVLALFAALGITVWVFQDLLGRGELTYYVPFAAAVLLLSLGSDYNVFIVGRIWQEARQRPLREAIVVGGARAATPITVAGLILAASFALLGLVPISGFQELACAMAVGLLLDAFLVRTLLVPALIALVGERSGWPGQRLRAASPSAPSSTVTAASPSRPR